ncbi:cellulose synthase [Burkholderia vietnamiensis]|jgi:hypothetical protein|uniref:cellulose synthase n=1 Tax=Burkholderia vietnamiensis TaxID=60552 RepID=UPI001B92A773|nr:cellulose synthase [Burkholderia vietnamiensis]MBR8160892.1 cellulose synthase [Burkholderia vietnamiensis]
MSSKQKITILAINLRSGTSKKTGRDYKIHEAQCVLESSSDGSSQIHVGMLNLTDEQVKAVDGRFPSDWIADFALGQGMGADAGRIVARIVSLTPLGMPKAKPAAGVAAV